MKCENCKTEMEKGIIDPKDAAWIPRNSITGGLLSFGKSFVSKMSQGKPLWAYRCPKCKKVELVTE